MDKLIIREKCLFPLLQQIEDTISGQMLISIYTNLVRIKTAEYFDLMFEWPILEGRTLFQMSIGYVCVYCTFVNREQRVNAKLCDRFELHCQGCSRCGTFYWRLVNWKFPSELFTAIVNIETLIRMTVLKHCRTLFEDCLLFWLSIPGLMHIVAEYLYIESPESQRQSKKRKIEEIK